MNISASNSKFESLRRFFEADPGNARLRRDCVDAAVAAGEFGFVRDLADKRLASAPADPEAQFDRATALIGLQDFAAAMEALRPLEASIPGVRFNAGLCLFMLGKYEEARPYFQAGYDAGERSPGLLRFLIVTLHWLGEIDTAIEIINANAGVMASDARLAGSASMLFSDKEDSANAQHWARIALAMDPDNVDALVSDGMVRATSLDAMGAKANFERALARAPDNGRAWLGLGSLTMLSRDFDKAGEQLQNAVKEMPGHLGSWHALAWSHLFANRLDEAERTWQQALDLNHNFSESHAGIAVIAALRGDRNAAERGIEVAERLDRACNTSQFARFLLESSEKGREAGIAFLADAVAKLPLHGQKLAQLLRKPPNRGPKR
jgi:tetratricopeptide (TPR) repeat protein